MKFLFLSFVSCILFFFVKETWTQATYVAKSEHPDHPGMCYYRDEPTFFLKPGQKRKHPKGCFMIHCTEDLGLSVTGCGVAANQGHCHYIAGDRSKPYPHCCGEYVC